MSSKAVICPNCGQDDVLKCGVNLKGLQLYACQNNMCKRVNISSPRFYIVKCRFCGGENVVKRGQTSAGKPLFSCNNADCKNKNLIFRFL